MNVLSLFNGMSFGAMALEALNIKVDNYYSSEIDKYANQATEALYPDAVQLGDVTKWREWDIDLGSIDLLIAGFPCQAWSLLGHQKGEEDPRGFLVYTLIDIYTQIKRLNPRVKFMFENTKMGPEHVVFLNKLFETDSVVIDSLSFCSQSRSRLFWSNIHINKIVPVQYSFSDVIGKTLTKKGWRPATCRKGNPRPIIFTGDHFKCLTATYFKGIRADGRPCVSVSGGVFDELREHGKVRALTPRECARLQTVPEHKIDILLSAGISNTQLYKMLGNGWTHDVIVHIFKGLL